ncbi:hypothetical protein [Hyphomicrobium sp.]|uniref:hypothetical protein n=1 Tax=Hyphomicrobium sp. TaxID=82 RepID=UPI002E338E90|nr:hypothetical protein [Hyphomicrobium sp.]HEX2842146.1 hypothetical protein [Hyphomicrobium sp.]
MTGKDVPRVRYSQRPDGSFDITVTNADAPHLRIDSYPRRIQEAAQGNFHCTLTLEERRKLRAAQDIGEPVYTAVWDDLVSARAEEMLHAPAVTLENGRDALTTPVHPSYHSREREL